MEDRDTRFRRLFDAHFGAIAAFADRRCPSGDADDVVAETFAVAWRRFDVVPSEDPLPWLYGVARKVLANQRRGRRRWFGLLIRLQNEPASMAVAGEQEPEVVAALRRLKPDEREVLLLAAWEGLSHREIGTALGISENAVSIRVHRARKRLADELSRDETAARKVRAAAGQSGV
jgi:RNA polymerase sigma-70 factor (ECF subfamily)